MAESRSSSSAFQQRLLAALEKQVECEQHFNAAQKAHEENVGKMLELLRTGVLSASQFVAVATSPSLVPCASSPTGEAPQSARHDQLPPATSGTDDVRPSSAVNIAHSNGI